MQYAHNYQICPSKRERWTMKRQKRRTLRSPRPSATPPTGKAGHAGPALRNEKTDAATINTVGAIHESPAAKATIPTLAGWMVSGNKIPPYGENAAVKQTRGVLSDAAGCDIILRYYTIMYPHPDVENLTRSNSGSYPAGCRWGRSPRRWPSCIPQSSRCRSGSCRAPPRSAGCRR